MRKFVYIIMLFLGCCSSVVPVIEHEVVIDIQTERLYYSVLQVWVGVDMVFPIMYRVFDLGRNYLGPIKIVTDSDWLRIRIGYKDGGGKTALIDTLIINSIDTLWVL